MTPSPHASVPWTVVAAAVCGTRHQKANQPCQDVVAWRSLPGPSLGAALADGAGSAPLGGMGAQLASEAALKALGNVADREHLPTHASAIQVALEETLARALKALTEAAKTQDLPLSDLATTLQVCWATPGWVAAAQVGDGAIVVSAADEVCWSITRPRAGEYLNETVFLTSAAALEQAQVTVWLGEARQVALMTDGLQMLALRMPEGAPHGPFFRTLFGWLDGVEDAAQARVELEQLLRSPRFTARTDDDLSLLLARRASGLPAAQANHTAARKPAP